MWLATAVLTALDIKQWLASELSFKFFQKQLLALLGLRFVGARQNMEIEARLRETFQPRKHFLVNVLLEARMSESFTDVKDMRVLIGVIEGEGFADGKDVESSLQPP